jgi:hypothetical protein
VFERDVHAHPDRSQRLIDVGEVTAHITALRS